MNAPHNPLLETLESRQHFAATPTPLPDLKAALNFDPTLYTFPGQKIKPKLVLTNAGAAMTKAVKLPVRLYLSKTPTLAPNSTPVKNATTNLVKLSANQTSSLPLSLTIPQDIPANRYYLIVWVNPKGATLKEKNVANNTATSAPMITPRGTYAGNFKAPNGDSGRLTITLSNGTADKHLKADALLQTKDATFTFKGLKATLNHVGKFKVADNGQMIAQGVGRASFHFSTVGTLLQNLLNAKLRISWSSLTNARNTFTDILLKPQKPAS